jgi:hypothetical protein
VIAVATTLDRVGSGIRTAGRPTQAPGRTTAHRVSGLEWCYRASVVIALLLGVAAGIGLFFRSIYHNNTFATAAFQGTDLVSFALALPVLAVSLFLARQGSRRAQLVWLGALGYVAYTYLYTFAIAWNRLFLGYVVLLSLSVFTIVRALTSIDAKEIAGRFSERAPARGVGIFLWVIGGLLGIIELAQVVPALVSGDVPDIVTKTGGATGVVYILDLGLVVPLMLLAGSWIRRRRPWGYVAAAILLVKGVAEGLALLSSNLFLHARHLKTDGPLMGLWVLIAVGSLSMLIRFMQSMQVKEVRHETLN